MTRQAYTNPPEALQKLLDLHRIWVESEGSRGQQLTDEAAGRKFEGLCLDGAFLRMSKLHGVEWVRCSLVKADLTLADLEDNLFLDCDLRSAVLAESDLNFVVVSDGTRIEGIDLSGANTSLAKMPTVGSLLTSLDLG